jgi:hypothetical protein
MKRICALLVFCMRLPAAGDTYGKLPLSFEANQGQTDAHVKFLARVPGYTLFVTGDEAVFAGRDGAVEQMKILGANRKMRVERLDMQPGVSNYFIGNDPSKWRTNIPNYGRMALRDAYPGIDLIFYSKDRHLEYDWLVAPGADPKQIRVRWEVGNRPRTDASGDLILSTRLRQKKPVILQGGEPVEGGYRVRGNEVAFDVGKYDTTKQLVIDPVLFYSTYLGGSATDQANAIAADGSGNTYVTGDTISINFPTAAPFQAANGGATDAFVTKINAAGVKVYSTYLGGSMDEFGESIAVDGSGNAYVAGWTTSTNFPTATPIQSASGGLVDGFVTKINTAGSMLVYSTYLGGSQNDVIHAIAVDGSGSAYVTGYTVSANFPTVNPLQAAGGNEDAFVTKINAAGSALTYSTYLGGSFSDNGNGIAVDSSGNAYVTGSTTSTDFPTTSPFQASNASGSGGTDAFVTKINAAGSAKVYSTYLGGLLNDSGLGIALDSAGDAYVTGYTGSNNFPVANAIQASLSGTQDAFATVFNAAGSALIYSTYLGGSGNEFGNAVAVDGAGNVYVTGLTDSTNFPTSNPIQATNHGGDDAFVTKLNSIGSTVLYSTYLGGSSQDFASGIAVDGSGNAYVSGYTVSTDFPTVSPLQASYGGGGDAFIFSMSGNSPTGAFRDTGGSIELTSELSKSLSSSGGAFASNPAAAQNANGDTFVVARDAFNALWVNVHDARTQLWDGWALAGGAVQGTPAVAAIGNVAYIAARDASNAYWTITYTRHSGFGAWTARGGNFATDPVLAAGAATVYFVGKDNSNSIWTATLTGSTFTAWQFDGAAVSGKPAMTVSADGAAYIAIRDPSNAVWMGRQNATTFNGWQPGGGTVGSDPQIAQAMTKVYAAALTASGVPWYNTFTQGTGNNWTGWQSPGGVLMDVAAAASSGPQLFLTGRDSSDQLWWYETPGAGWRFVGAVGLAVGPLSAAPR